MKNLKYISIAILSIIIQQTTLATDNGIRLNTENLKTIEEVLELPLSEEGSREHKTNLNLDSLKTIEEEEEQITEDVDFTKEEVRKYSSKKPRIPLKGLIEIRADEGLQELF